MALNTAKRRNFLSKGKIFPMPDQFPHHMPPAIICADDFGLTAGISQSILELAQAGAISATGAMTNRPHWETFGPQLRALDGRIDIGLHFNLTCAMPLTSMPDLVIDGQFPGLASVVRKALFSVAARQQIRAELDAQLDSFEAVIGRMPDFLDGHQHVHAMPGIRSIVLSVLQKRYGRSAARPYLRDSSDTVRAILARGVSPAKALVICALCFGFGARARALGFATNGSFAGVSPFDPRRDFMADLVAFHLSPASRHLVMVHPGYLDEELEQLDPVTQTRPQEHAALHDLALACRIFPIRMKQMDQ
jgi:chitin disaccharide deacetylase